MNGTDPEKSLLFAEITSRQAKEHGTKSNGYGWCTSSSNSSSVLTLTPKGTRAAENSNKAAVFVHLQPETGIFAGKSACIISFLILLHKERLLLFCFTDESNAWNGSVLEQQVGFGTCIRTWAIHKQPFPKKSTANICFGASSVYRESYSRNSSCTYLFAYWRQKRNGITYLITLHAAMQQSTTLTVFSPINTNSHLLSFNTW